MGFYAKRRALAAVMAVVMVALLLPAAVAAQYPCTGYTTDSLNMRKRASINGDLILVIPAGDAVYISGESGLFYIVEYDGLQGYAMKSFITLSQPAWQDNAATPQQLTDYQPLRKGHAGEAVTALQSALIELGFLSGKADGKYGDQTAAAVAAFQNKNGLYDAGGADAATQALLFEGKPLNAKGKQVSVKTLPPIDGYPMTQGDEGAQVKRLQSALTLLGYYKGDIDGKYGSGTASAVKKFQQKNGLTATGDADSATQALLSSGTALSAAATPTPPPAATPKPAPVETTPPLVFPFVAATLDSVNLRKSHSISSSRILAIPKGAFVTVEAFAGDFALVTYQAAYKTYKGYAMTRYIDIPPEYLGGAVLPGDTQAQQSYTSLTASASGDVVATLQEALRELGFYAQADATGYYDAATVTAVKAFQKANGLLQTGFATSEIQKLLYEGKPYNSSGKKTDVKTLPPIAGYTMRSGDRGLAVAELQTALIALGYMTGLPTADYDAATLAAVKAFQRNSGLKVDGVAGPQTQAALAAQYATPTPPPVVLATPTPEPITPENVIVIHKNTRGMVVTRLQERLVELGYYAITPDGIYDADDIVAVRAFQQKHGLEVDGVAGLMTQLALYDAAALPAWATATPPPVTPAPVATLGPDMNISLKIGASGNDVSLLQARLTTLQYLNDAIDGRFGTKTAIAVTSFQSVNGLEADGIAGPRTLAKLYSPSAKAAPAATATPTPTPTPPADELIKIGASGSHVKNAQSRLITLGYLTGAADGIFGPKTYLAVKAFQKNNNLLSDGIIGASTLKKLSDGSASPAPGIVTPTPPPTQDIPGTAFKAPVAREVRFADWYTEIRELAKKMPNVIIYDYTTGLHYNVHMFSLGKHADAEPVTASDTAIMRQIMGRDNWTAHAVWVVFSNGTVYMASTHSKGHDVDNNRNNDLTGHICIHFPREMSDAQATGPYAVSHQNAILAGWDVTQNMLR